MNVTIEMMQYAVANYPEACPKALEVAAANLDDNIETLHIDGDTPLEFYSKSLAEAVEEFAPRITVAGLFGKDKQVTRKEFTAIWEQHVSELQRLIPSLKRSRYLGIKKEIVNAANNEFDRIYTEAALEAEAIAEALKPTVKVGKKKDNSTGVVAA